MITRRGFLQAASALTTLLAAPSTLTAEDGASVLWRPTGPAILPAHLGDLRVTIRQGPVTLTEFVLPPGEGRQWVPLPGTPPIVLADGAEISTLTVLCWRRDPAGRLTIVNSQANGWGEEIPVGPYVTEPAHVRGVDRGREKGR